MDKNKFNKYYTILLIYENNHSKIFTSEKISTTLDMMIINQYA